MIQFHVYPGGKKRIVTFSYDDGHDKDARLIEMFDRHGVKGTFHLNSLKFADYTEEQRAELRARYAGHEVACHTVHHGWPARMPLASLTEEIMNDRKALEAIFGYPILGMSYPSGSFSEEALIAHRACGIVYSRPPFRTRSSSCPKISLPGIPPVTIRTRFRSATILWRAWTPNGRTRSFTSGGTLMSSGLRRIGR